MAAFCTGVGRDGAVRVPSRHKFVTRVARLPHGSAWVRGGQDLTVHDTWSTSQLQALVKAHACLIQDYKCAEWRPQDPADEIHAPAAPAPDQVPQAPTPLLIPPLNQLAHLQLPAARAHGENAENAQEGRGLRMPDQRRITREIMRGWAPHKDARENGAPQSRATALHQRHATQTFDCISRTVEGQPGHLRLQASMPDEEDRDCAPGNRFKNHLDAKRLSDLLRSRHGFLHFRGFQ